MTKIVNKLALTAFLLYIIKVLRLEIERTIDTHANNQIRLVLTLYCVVKKSLCITDEQRKLKIERTINTNVNNN